MKGKRDVTMTFDLDKCFALAQKLPALVAGAAGEVGIPLPVWVQKGLPLLAMGGKLATEFIEVGSGTGLEFAGLPDTGPLGRGRLEYLRIRQSFSDEDVVHAARCITSRTPQLPAAESIVAAIDFALSFQQPGVSLNGSIQPNAKQLRKAIDTVLERQSLPSEMCDKFGDVLLWTLRYVSAEKPAGIQKS